MARCRRGVLGGPAWGLMLLVAAAACGGSWTRTVTVLDAPTRVRIARANEAGLACAAACNGRTSCIAECPNASAEYGACPVAPSRPSSPVAPEAVCFESAPRTVTLDEEGRCRDRPETGTRVVTCRDIAPSTGGTSFARFLLSAPLLLLLLLPVL